MSNTGGEADHRDLRMVRIKVGSHETQPALSMIEDTSNLNPNEYSNDVFIYPAEWLCLASPVLRAMLTGGWEETRHATLELLQFTPRQFSSFLGLLTANISKGFGGPERYIKANEYATLIEETGPVIEYLQCWDMRDDLRCQVERDATLEAVAVYERLLGPTEINPPDWPVAVYCTLASQALSNEEIRPGEMCKICQSELANCNQCSVCGCTQDRLRSFHIQISARMAAAVTSGMRPPTVVRLLKEIHTDLVVVCRPRRGSPPHKG